jgi:hypothetical protein
LNEIIGNRSLQDFGSFQHGKLPKSKIWTERLHMTYMTENQQPTRDCIGCVAVVLTIIWIIGVSFSIQFVAWLGTNLFADVATAYWMPPATLWQGCLLAVPLLPLAIFWPVLRYRAIFQMWLIAVGFLVILTPTRYLASNSSQIAALLQMILTIGYIVIVGVILFFLKRPAGYWKPVATAIPLAFGIAAIFAYPWLAWGALGSPIDTLLNLTTGLAFGIISSLLIKHFGLYALKTDTYNFGWDMFTGGLFIGTMLLIMVSSSGFNGLQLALMIALPAIGWTIMAVSHAGQPDTPEKNWPAVALLIGLAIAFPLMLTDTDGFILQAMDPILTLTFRAAGLSVIIAWGVGLILILAHRHLAGFRPNLIFFGVVFSLWVIASLVYAFAGKPGFYGDRLFVILKDQADVSSASSIDNYDERREFVYHTLVDHADTTQADLRTMLDTLGVDYTPYYLVNAIEIRGGWIHWFWLMTRPEVDRILSVPMLRPLPEPLEHSAGYAEPPAKPQWNLTNIGADKVWKELGVTGKGIVIGQSDSGVDLEHPELKSSYRGADGQNDYNWLDPWYSTTSPVDFGGHGTHTLGSIVGQNVGVAPGAIWFGCANLTRNLANAPLYLDCMQFMLAPYPLGSNPFTDGDPTKSAHVLNNSWGCPEREEGCDPTSLQPAVKALRDAGIFVVVSAGNEGPDCGSVASPLALYDEVFSVGAIDQSNDLASFSSVGPVTADGSGRTKPDILAPGVDVLSAFPDGSYETASGTSMAGPHIVGVVALIWSANPALIGDIERTEQILIETAQPFNGEIAGDSSGKGCLAETDLTVIPNNVAGYGIVDAYAAVRMALALE